MARVESFSAQEIVGRPVVDDDFDVVELLAKLARQLFDYLQDLFSDLAVIQGSFSVDPASRGGNH